MKLEFLKEPQIKFLKEKKYLRDGETPVDRFTQIVERVRDYEEMYQDPGLADRIAYLLDKNILSLSTPALGNFGRPKPKGSSTQPLPCSCNIVGVDNSIDGIYSANHEAAMLSKLGAGVGIDFMNVCQKGTKIDEGFYTNPKMDWIEAIVDTTQKVSQNALRRGYGTPFLCITDSEYYDLLKAVDKSNPDANSVLVDNTIGIIIPEGFMKEMSDGNKEWQKRWVKLLKAREKGGQVYIVFVENMNKNQSPVYKELGLSLTQTNICCVTGDQLVATEQGFKTVKELSDLNCDLRLFDNESTYNSTAMLYRGHADAYKITLKNGMTHTITSNHELIVKQGRISIQKSIDTGLSTGDKVKVQTNKGLFGKNHEPGLAFLLGLFLGDGTSHRKGDTILSLWQNDFDLIEECESICGEFFSREGIYKHPNNKLPKFIPANTSDSEVARKNLHTTLFERNGFKFQKMEIPNWIWSGDEETHWQFFRGLLYSDGTVGDYSTGKSFGQPISLSLASTDLNFLRKLQILVSNLGVNCKIYPLREKGKSYLPKNDGSGESSWFDCQESYRLVISNKNDLLKIEEETKFLSRKAVSLEDREYRDNTKKYSEIISIEHVGTEDVYCPTVDSDKHLWVCNGLVTSNTEMVCPFLPDMTFACIISALNLKYWDLIKEDHQMIEDCFIFLDILVEEYILLTKGVAGMERARNSAIHKRDIGLGTLGFHELLQMKGYAYGDFYSKQLNEEIYSTIRKVGERTTKKLAAKLGPAPMCVEAGMSRRNVSLMAVAPNKSTSFISGATSPGIEAFFSNIFMKKLAGIQEVFKNPHLERLLEVKGRNNSETWESISKNLGSVQHLDFLSKREKDIFRTFSEISPKDIIDLAADRQKHIDMAQSINLMNRPNFTLKDLHDIHVYAYEQGIKTLYYFFPQAHAAIEREGEEWTACVSCAD